MIHKIEDFHNAQNSDDPQELMRLSLSFDPTIRSYVAENVHTPIEVVERLSLDPSPSVCLYVLRNPKCSIPLCNSLLVHKDFTVRREAGLKMLAYHKKGQITLEQKELFDLIKTIDPKANNLDAIEALVEINEKVDGTNA